MLGFNLAAPGDSTRPHPLFGDVTCGGALFMATDRERAAAQRVGDLAKVPPGRCPQLWWIGIRRSGELAYDSGQAARLLTRRAGSTRTATAPRQGRPPLAFRLLLPTTSAIRASTRALLQEQFRVAGVDVQLDEVDFGLYNERARAGRFDALLNTWNTDPTPSSGFSQTWTPAGFGAPTTHGTTTRTWTGWWTRRWRLGREPRPGTPRLPGCRRDSNRTRPAFSLFATSNVGGVHSGSWDGTIAGPDSGSRCSGGAVRHRLTARRGVPGRGSRPTPRPCPPAGPRPGCRTVL